MSELAIVSASNPLLQHMADQGCFLSTAQVGITLDTILADADYQTIAGLMLSQLNTSPTADLIVNFANHSFEIVDMGRHSIDKILITARA